MVVVFVGLFVNFVCNPVVGLVDFFLNINSFPEDYGLDVKLGPALKLVGFEDDLVLRLVNVALNFGLGFGSRNMNCQCLFALDLPVWSYKYFVYHYLEQSFEAVNAVSLDSYMPVNHCLYYSDFIYC